MVGLKTCDSTTNKRNFVFGVMDNLKKKITRSVSLGHFATRKKNFLDFQNSNFGFCRCRYSSSPKPKSCLVTRVGQLSMCSGTVNLAGESSSSNSGTPKHNPQNSGPRNRYDFLLG